MPRIRSALLAGAALAFAQPSPASVVVVGTRVIYPGGAREQTLQLNNPDEAPSVVQVWIDNGNADSTPENAQAPFLVTPPVFRIEPHAGQMVRIVFTGGELPQDRESVFFLNTLQIPAFDPAEAERNRMLLLLRNRLKLFHRPAGLPGSAESAAEALRFGIARSGADWTLIADNGSAFHVSLIELRIVGEGLAIDLAPRMVAPKSSQSWRVESRADLAASARKILLRFVNDHGGDGKVELPLGPLR